MQITYLGLLGELVVKNLLAIAGVVKRLEFDP